MMEIEKEFINIGILGEDGSGKTTLLNAISFVYNQEIISNEKLNKFFDIRDNLNISFSKLKYEIDKDLFLFIDCPAEKDFKKALITRSLEIDSYILVVSADCIVNEKNLKSQLEILKQLTTQAVFIFFNKMDIATDEEVLLTENLIKKLLLDCKIDYNKIFYIYGSVKKVLEGEDDFSCIYVLIETIKEQMLKKVFNKEKEFYMPIEEICWIKEKREKAICGNIWDGTIKIEDMVEVAGLLDSSKIGKCIGLIELDQNVLEAEAGHNIKVFLDHIDIDKIQRGQILTKPGTLGAHFSFSAYLYLFTREEGGGGKTLVKKDYVQYFQYAYNREHCFGELWVLEENIRSYKQGEVAFIKGKFRTPKPIRKKDIILLEENKEIIGMGFISEILDKKGKEKDKTDV